MTNCARAGGYAVSNYPFLTLKERDNETGLDYFPARYYSSKQGRFISPDSFGGRVVNPQTLNLYSYVLNNPLKLVDPLGHQDELPQKKGKKGDQDEDPPDGPLDVVVINSVPGLGEPPPPPVLVPTSTVNTVTQTLQRWTRQVQHFDFKLVTFGMSPISSTIGAIWGERAVREYHHATMALLPLAFEAGIEMRSEEAAAAMEGRLDALFELAAESVVVRGGQSALPARGEVFSGAVGKTIQDAAAFVPHGTIRATTVEAIQSIGGTVVLKPELTRGGVLNPRHVNITEGAHGSSTFSTPFANPVPKKLRIE